MTQQHLKKRRQTRIRKTAKETPVQQPKLAKQATVFEKNQAVFPKIYRSFSDPKVLTVLLSVILFIALLFASFDAYNLYTQKKKTEDERVAVSEKIKTWEEIAQKYPGYRDAYFILSGLSLRLGEKEKAREYLKKTLEIDPNFEKGIELKKEME